MKNITKVLLALTILFLGVGLLFVTGIISVGEATALYVLFPIGASLYGLFLFSLVFEKRFAAAEAEEARESAARKASSAAGKNRKSRQEAMPVAAHHQPSRA